MNNPKERPVALTAEEVNAVLAGDKTQHRVPVKLRYGSPEFLGSRDCNKSDPSLWGWDNFEDGDVRILSEIKCPFGKAGDRLWVRETHHAPDFLHDYEVKELAEGLITLESLGVTYRADAPHMTPADGGWCSPIGMPRWASRLLLEITDIRIERLKDISEDNAIAQGVQRQGDSWVNYKFPTDSHCAIDARTSFATFWQSNNGENSWDLNPWVWVVEFKAIVPASDTQSNALKIFSTKELPQ